MTPHPLTTKYTMSPHHLSTKSMADSRIGHSWGETYF
jgi:hypothetical protein